MNYSTVSKKLNDTIIKKCPFILKDNKKNISISTQEDVVAFSDGTSEAAKNLRTWDDLNTIEKETLLQTLIHRSRKDGEIALSVDLVMHAMKFPGLKGAPTPAQLNEGFSIYADKDREQYDTALNKLYYQLFNGKTHQPQTKPAVLAADLLKTIGTKNEDAKKLIERLDKETISKTTNSESLTALHIAMAPGDEEIAAALIKKGVDVNIKSGELETPLHYAALYANPDVLPLLFENKADVNAQNKYGLTPLDWVISRERGIKDPAEKKRHEQVITKLKEAGGKTKAELEKEQQEQKAAQLNKLGKLLLTVIGQPDGQKRALEIINSLEAEQLNNTKDAQGHTALHCAANIGNVEITKALLAKKGINLEVTDNGGNTALHQAAYNDKSEIIDLLVKAGANKEAVDTSGHTPLMDAVANDKLGATQKLIEHKANVNAKPQLQTPLDLAKSDAIKEALINAGATKEIEVVRRLYNISEQDYEKMQKRIKTKGEKPKYDKAAAHQTVVDWAADRNKNRPKNKLKPTAYAQGIKNIKRMEELGLLPKGINGISNAEVYLYRLHQSRLFYSPQELVKHTNGEFITIDKALGSESGKAFRTVFKDLTSKELTDDQLKDYARTVLVTEGCVNNFGQCRTTPKIPEKGKNASYNAGASHNIETASETLTKSGKDITQDTEYDISDDLKRKDNLLVLNASQKNR